MRTLFEPLACTTPENQNSAASFGERGHGRVYVFDERTVFAVQAAQVTGRPLLLRGPAGSGKSSLAPFVANTLAHPFYMFTVTARTQARDLMWDFDALGRLNDANVSAADPDAKSRVGSLYNYIVPGKLWWAFDRRTACRRGAPDAVRLDVADAVDPNQAPTATTPQDDPDLAAVLLIDEIDKADPDVPNNLLEALGSRQFTVQETGTRVQDRQSPLVIITTNEERELPQAFLRRCVTLHLREKTRPELARIALEHFANSPKLSAFSDKHYAGDPVPFFEEVAKTIDILREAARKRGDRPPSTAEYLDTLVACIELDVKPVELPVAPPSQATPASGEAAGAAAARPETNEGRRWRHAIEVALTKRSEGQ